MNVPNSEITQKNKHFFQQQITSNSSFSQFSSTYNYGLGKGMEIGLNVWMLNLDHKTFRFSSSTIKKDEPINPMIMINGAKQFLLNENQSLTFGTQLGTSFNYPTIKNGLGLIYFNYKLTDLFTSKSLLIVGSYYNSINYGGSGNRIGAWIGLDVPLSQKFCLMGETILGSNYISTSCLGFVYSPKPNLPLTFAMQIPNNIHTATSFVFELTILPKK